MRGRAVVAVVVIGACGLLAGCDQWTHLRQGPAGTGFNPFETKIGAANVGTLAPAWTANLGGGNVGTPLQAGGLVYTAINGVAGSSGTLFVRDAASGAHVWSVTFGGGCGETGECFSPSLTYALSHGGTLVVARALGLDLGELAAYDARTGAPKWSSSFGAAVSPVVTDGKVYVATARFSPGLVSGLTVHDAATGALLFRGDTASQVVSAQLSVAGGRVFFVQGDVLEVYDAAGTANCSGGPPKTCTPLWSASLGATSAATPAVTGDTVYVTSEAGNLLAFAAAGCGQPSCAPVWTGSVGSLPIHGSAAVANGVVYVGGHDGALYAFAASGCGQAGCAPLWSGPTGGSIYASPAVANGVVYVTATDNTAYAFAASGCGDASCEPLWSASTGGLPSSPTVATGRVVVGSGDGTLRAYTLG
jgi:outer membrane protein assembly factor BamB